MTVEVTGFDWIKGDYPTCPDFGELYTSLLENQSRRNNEFVLQEGFLFKGRKLSL